MFTTISSTFFWRLQHHRQAMRNLKSSAHGIPSAKKLWKNSTDSVRTKSSLRCDLDHMWIVNVLQSHKRLGYILWAKTLVPNNMYVVDALPAGKFSAYNTPMITEPHKNCFWRIIIWQYLHNRFHHKNHNTALLLHLRLIPHLPWLKPSFFPPLSNIITESLKELNKIFL